jgi:hypothetical protein
MVEFGDDSSSQSRIIGTDFLRKQLLLSKQTVKSRSSIGRVQMALPRPLRLD